MILNSGNFRDVAGGVVKIVFFERINIFVFYMNFYILMWGALNRAGTHPSNHETNPLFEVSTSSHKLDPSNF